MCPAIQKNSNIRLDIQLKYNFEIPVVLLIIVVFPLNLTRGKPTKENKYTFKRVRLN